MLPQRTMQRAKLRPAVSCSLLFSRFHRDKRAILTQPACDTHHIAPSSKLRRRATLDISQCNQIKCTVSAKMLEKSWRPLAAGDQAAMSSQFSEVLNSVLGECSSREDRSKIQKVFNSLSSSYVFDDHDCLESQLIQISR